MLHAHTRLQGKQLDKCLESAAHCLTCQSGATEVVCPVFISFRVNEASPEAATLQARPPPRTAASAYPPLCAHSTHGMRGKTANPKLGLTALSALRPPSDRLN
jgi:hypothetical protein